MLFKTDMKDLQRKQPDIIRDQHIRVLITAIEQSPSSIMVTNTKGEIEYVNPQFCIESGYAIDEVYLHNARMLKSSITPRQTHQSLWETITTGNVWRGELINKKKNGELYYEDCIISPVYDEEMNISHFLAIKENVTQQKLQQQALREQTANLQALIENTHDYIWSVDTHLNIIIINQIFKDEFKKTFGIELQKGSYALADLPEPYREMWQKRYERVLGGESFKEADHYEISGHDSWYETIFTPIRLDNQIIGASCYTRDISQLKQVEVDIKQKSANLAAVIENTSDRIWSVNRCFKILTVNSNFASDYLNAFGVELHEGVDIVSQSPEPYRSLWRSRYERALKGEHFSEMDFFDIAGTPKYTETSFNPIIYDGMIKGVSCYARDITNQKIEEQVMRDNEKQLSTVFNNIDSGVLLIDKANETIAYVNEYMLNLLETGNEQLLGQNSSILQFSSDKSHHPHKQNKLHNFEDKLITVNGKEVPVMRSLSEIRLREKKYVIHSVVNLTSLKNQEEQIRRLNISALKFMSFQQTADIFGFIAHEVSSLLSDAVVIVSTINNSNTTIAMQYITGIPEHAFVKMVKLLGFNPIGKSMPLSEELLEIFNERKLKLVKSGIKHLLPDDIKLTVITSIEQLLPSHHIYTAGIRHHDYLYGSVTLISPHPYAATHSYFIETLLLQASIAIHRKHLENELKYAKEEAEKANRAKGIFLANLGHEIRTPMNAVIGFTEILNKSASDATTKGYLQSILSSGKTMLSIINDLLDLSKIEEGEMRLRPAPCQLMSILDEMYHIFNLKTKEKGVNLLFQTDPLLTQYLVLDDLRIRQILLNLMSNAEKFTDKGFIRVVSKATLTPQSTMHISISVEDSGIGIPQNMLTQIFNAFQQQDEQDNRKYGGTGLGLSISRKLAELMNGQITVKSTHGKGSTFTLNIPSVPLAMEENLPIENITAPIVSTSFKPASIIIADDLELNRLLIKTFLRDTGIHYYEASNGQEAIEQAIKHHPQLILMDLKMPVLDGFGAVKQMKANAALSQIPVLALTGLTDSEQEIKEAGFSAYLCKPFTMDELFILLARFLPLKESNDESQNQPPAVEPIHEPSKTPLPELIHIIDNELLPIWHSFSTRQAMSEIENFALELLRVGNNFKVELLVKYATQLLEKVNSFDVIEIRLLLKQFTGVVSQIKKQF
jgi:PAS domain S-box-containing protein